MLDKSHLTKNLINMRKKPEPLAGVFQESGFSAKLNIRNSNKHLCKIEHLCL